MNNDEIKETLEKINEELYLWLLYPLSVRDQVLEKLETLGTIEKEIISFIYEKGSITLVQIMDQLDDFDKEDILFSVFNLVNSNLILTKLND